MERQPGPHHLAQLNIARLRFPRGAPELQDYHSALAAVMPIAQDWPGFLWIHDDSIIALSEQAFGPCIAANLSLWTDIAALEAFMTCRVHQQVMAQRDAWFDILPDASFVLWWLPAGQKPEFQDACDRLTLLRRDGPGPDAFTLEARFAPPP